MIDTYSIYHAHCLARGVTPPSREWWDTACAQRKPVAPQSDLEFDVETERREGWGYDKS